MFWPKWVVFRNGLYRGQVASNTTFPSSTPKSFPTCKISSKLDFRLLSYELLGTENLTFASPFKMGLNNQGWKWKGEEPWKLETGGSKKDEILAIVTRDPK